MDKIVEARRVFDIEIEALKKTRDQLDNTFIKILDMITSCKGKLIITGMGKSGHIANKLAATFASLGTPSFYLHPGEAVHGDLGMISQSDVILIMSYSGESDEIVNILPSIKMIGASIVGITSNGKSTLAKSADVIQVLPKFQEACYLGLAPTSSTTVELCYGDALAVVASAVYGFRDVDFGKFHPAGSLGKKLILRVEDLMTKGSDNAVINQTASMKDAIIELSKKGLGAVTVINDSGEMIGIITDGDLRRQLEQGADIYSLSANEVMSRKPYYIMKDKMAVEALRMLKDNRLSCLPVIEDKKPVGIIRLHDIIGAGIVG